VRADVFVRDLVAGTTRLVSTGPDGVGASGLSIDPAVSADGRFVAFVSSADDIVPMGNQVGVHVFVRDTLLGTTRLASVDGTQSTVFEIAKRPSMARDGRQIAFTTNAQLEIADQNQVDDVYASGSPALAYSNVCEGTAGTCPCGNAGAPGSGCANSFEPAGARLTASGLPSVSDDSLALVAIRLVPDTGALFVQSGTAFVTASAPALGDGVRCIAGTVLRLGARLSTGDSVVLGAAGDARLSVLGHLPAAGAARFYQVVYRNTLPFCTPGTINTTNAIRVDWSP
jgi:hypothetical protein